MTNITNIRKTITKARSANEEEFADQIDYMGDAHYKESQEEYKKAVAEQIADMRKRHNDGESDAYMQDVLVGAKLQQKFPHENHESRWQRQHKVAVELDAINDKLRLEPMGSESYMDLMSKRVALESLL